jgi:hypothetical protein
MKKEFLHAFCHISDRFLLHFGKTMTGISNEESSAVNAYTYENVVYVYTPDAACSIEIYDMLGNLILNKLSEKGLNILQTNASKGVYIVKVQNGTNATTEKVIIK